MSRLRSSITVSLGIALLLGAGVGCSSHPAASKSQAQEISPPDAGTDAVPQGAVEDLSGQPPAANADLTPPPPIAENEPAAQPPQGDTPPPPTAPEAVPPPPVSDAEATPPAGTTTPPPSEDSSSGNYTVQAGDTLMKIAFEKYGDLYKWKDIYDANKDRISNPNALPPGTVLKLDGLPDDFVIAKNGSEYLIKHGDTLGSISDDVYGTQRKWKRLWENNKQMIQDPNKIYAGFFLYYTLTPQEREDFERRKGHQPPAPQVNPAPVAQKTKSPKREVASVRSLGAPAEKTPPPQPQAAPPAQVQPSQRDPSSVLPPKVEPTKVDATDSALPPPPALDSAPPPADHSADLNEVIERAQKDETNSMIPATAGP